MIRIMITMMIMIIIKTDKIIVILVVCVSIIGPFEEPGLQASFESVR